MNKTPKILRERIQQLEVEIEELKFRQSIDPAGLEQGLFLRAFLYRLQKKMD